MPEQAFGSRRVLVPENLWVFIYETASAVKPDDTEGCSVFASDSEPCPQCSVELTEVACMEDYRRLLDNICIYISCRIKLTHFCSCLTILFMLQRAQVETTPIS